MRWRFTTFIPVVAALTIAPTHALEPSPHEGIARLKTDGSEAAVMAEAMRQARVSLASFLALADNPRPGTRDFSVKIGLPTVNGKEYVWIRPFQHKGTRIVGELQNEPVGTKAIRMGERISFDDKDVVDWSYLDGDGLRGNFTACAIAQLKPPIERTAFVKRYRLDCSFP